jgi:hypothetical protein
VLGLPWNRIGWPLFAAIGCMVFALATPVRWGTSEVVHLNVYDHLAIVTQSFRSSGRFVWPLLYCIVSAALAVLIRALQPSRLILTATLSVAVGVQAYDVDPSDAWARYQAAPLRLLRAAEWSLADAGIRHLVLFPAEVYEACGGPQGYRGGPVIELAYLAYAHKWTFNSGYAARVARATGDYCARLRTQINAGKLRHDELYIVWPGDLATFRGAGASCGMIDGVLACVKPENDAAAFATYLRDHPEPRRRRRQAIHP